MCWCVRAATSSVSHAGGTYGQNTFLMVCPDHGVALSVLTNAGGTGAELANDASRWVLERLTGFSQAQTPVAPASGDVLEQCVGVYRTPVEDVEIGRLGEALVARPIDRGGFPTRSTPPLAHATPPLIRLGFYAEDRLVGLDPGFLDTRAELIRESDNAIAWLRFGSRAHRRVG